ncbi:uncharacterized protein SPPG_08433 [Spizellomyces punctatus DAOM BR117]|uniref:DNA helicase n=1 Tax=Spizellomyces punctatus (strain DAOM BR117) TaxID=645134 RepID=A0A0L0H5T5_SPIPD|nr:uncharacterized protein SPPG_08433 [Spizellomyces punctatus DAOM BR117]KNC96281.1 hypothetical protein SPPG_08433 [Spizellomyces punctatus DAOM BR117]|eukprot:XP_016604321.1 hypothetical protein SPPG_08433 [Spizellomyces punctatus DAOM BR117]
MISDDELFADLDLDDDACLQALANVEREYGSVDGRTVKESEKKNPSSVPNGDFTDSGKRQRTLGQFVRKLNANQNGIGAAQTGTSGTRSNETSSGSHHPQTLRTFRAALAAPASPSSESVPSFHPVDPEAIKTWIYPTNVPVRDYQFNIVSRCLHVNTLVSLPTGLGKTFIAAVVMFNFFRWFPDGKIIFMAPTKPLVAQQIEACYKITGIPQDATEELTGTTSPDARRLSWIHKRVFFLTPQVMQNDLNRGTCPSQNVVLLVVDEAHRATGNHAYCEVVRELRLRNQRFRILALTATPGSDTKTVQQVVGNMLIARIEIRTEDSLDIKPFIFQRALELVTVPLSDAITSLQTTLNKVTQVFINRLCKAKAFYRNDPQNVGRYELLLARDRWRQELRNQQGTQGVMTPGRAASLEGDFGVAMTLAAAMQFLVVHGIRTCYSHLHSYVEEAQKSGARISRSRAELLKNRDFLGLMSRIKQLMGSPTFSSHPKLDRLVSLVVQHFVEHAEETQRLTEDGRSTECRETRVMVFSQFRESVEEIKAALEQHKPMIRVMSFVGQSAGGKGTKKGFSQKEQLRVLSEFQKGNYNVLVATSIGEEGLDIGEVDLILCYDVQNSPIRMLQRMGRTGRKRQGKVILLLTEGKEEDAHRRSQAQYKTVQKAITDQQGKKLQMFSEDQCRMLPPGTKPVCVKMQLDIAQYTAKNGSKRPKRVSDATHEAEDAECVGPFLTTEEQKDYDRRYRVLEHEARTVDIARYTYWQTQELPELKIQRSRRCRAFVSSVQLMEQLALDEEEGKPSTYAEQIGQWLDLGDVNQHDAGVRRMQTVANQRETDDCAQFQEPFHSENLEKMDDVPILLPSATGSKPQRPILGLSDIHDILESEYENHDDLDDLLMQEIPSAVDTVTTRQAVTPRLVSTEGQSLRPRCRLQAKNKPLSMLSRTPKLVAGSTAEEVPKANTPELSQNFDPVEYDDDWSHDEAFLVYESPCRATACAKDEPLVTSSLLRQPITGERPTVAIGDPTELENRDSDVIQNMDEAVNELDPVSPAVDAEYHIDNSFLAELDKMELDEICSSPKPPCQKIVFKVPESIAAVKMQANPEHGSRGAKSPSSPKNDGMALSQSPMLAGKMRSKFRIDDSPSSQLPVLCEQVNGPGSPDAGATQLATQRSGRAMKRLRRVKSLSRHTPLGSLSRLRGSQSIRKGHLRVAGLMKKLNQKKLPRGPPMERGRQVVENMNSRQRQQEGIRIPRKQQPKPSGEENPFLDHEVEVSADEADESEDEDPGEEDWDQDLSGFVVTDTQTPSHVAVSSSNVSFDVEESPSDKMAFYQRSLLSPAMGGFGTRKAGGYKFAWGRVTPGKRRFGDTPERVRESELSEDEDTTLSGFIVSDDDLEEEDISQPDDGANSANSSQNDTGFVRLLKRTVIEDDSEVDIESPSKKIRIEGSEQHDEVRLNLPQERVTKPLAAGPVAHQTGGVLSDNSKQPLQSLPVGISGNIGSGDISHERSSLQCIKPWQKSVNVVKLSSGQSNTVRISTVPSRQQEPIAECKVELDGLARAAVEDAMQIDWDDDDWEDTDLQNDNIPVHPGQLEIAETAACSFLDPSRLNLNGKSEMPSSETAEQIAYSPFKMQGPSPLKDIGALSKKQRELLFIHESPTAHIEKVQQHSGNKLVILVDTREMRSSICSLLRNKFKLRTEIRQLAFGDYVVSNRVAVERKTKTDLLNSVYNKRVFEQIENLKSMCEKPILIVEQEASEGQQSMAATTQFEGIIASLIRMQITVLFSDSAEETAQLLYNFAMAEAEEGARIDVPDLLPDKKNQFLQFLLSIPGISDVTAMAIMNTRVKSVREFVNCDIDDIIKKIPGMGSSRARTIHKYLRTKYRDNEVGDSGPV